MQKKKVRHLTALLLKSEASSFKAALKEPGVLTSYALRTTLPFKGRLYVQAARYRPPAWRDFVQGGVDRQVEDLMNASTAAVLFLKAAGRRFAYTFGYGRNLLKPESFERDFGLKVALNTVDPENLRSLDMRTFEDLTLHTRRQASRGATLDTFGLDISHDMLRAVTGKPKDESFARKVTGADALAIALQADFDDLGRISKKLLMAYKRDDYKDRFGFIDHLRAVRDPATITALQDRLLDALRSGTTDQVHLAPPEPVDWERVEAFTYTTQRDVEYADLDVDEYLATIDDLDQLNTANLKAHRIGLRYVGSNQSHEQWSVYQSIVFETEENSHVYVLSAGDWFEIAKTFAENVAERLAAVPKSKLGLPRAKASETEGAYNCRVARANGFALMDGKLVRARDANANIEVCDLFTKDRQFIHVKKKTRSATLSHLFAQGVVSAETFLWDDDYRKAAKTKIWTARHILASRIPDVRPVASEFEIVYAIITTMKAPKWPKGLPFFSQLNLVNAADRLSRLGYKVSLARIEEQ